MWPLYTVEPMSTQYNSSILCNLHAQIPEPTLQNVDAQILDGHHWFGAFNSRTARYGVATINRLLK